MSLKGFIREYFTYNRRERNGVFILLSIILLLILYLSFSAYFSPTDKTDFSQFEKEVTQFETSLRQKNDSVFTNAYNPSSSKYNQKKIIDNHHAAGERFLFNPNQLPEKDWNRMGFSDKQIRVIKNYEQKGGTFRTKEDVKKMYCISPKEYASIESYIQIPKIWKKNTYQDAHPVKDSLIKLHIDLNIADTLMLDKLHGIGFTYAKRIIKYRERLGGFVNKNQLLEVYGISREVYDKIAPFVFIDSVYIKKINLNTVDFETIKQHPYIRYNLANLIINYRKSHGKYKSVEDIKYLRLMNDEIFSKLYPYLTVK